MRQKLQRPDNELGSMFLYSYQAKWAQQLKYWDKLPLTIVFDRGEKHFTGLNLHYLAPGWRLKLLSELYEFRTNKNYDETTKLKFTYEMLKGVSRLRAYKPCIKKYLFSQMRSEHVYIPPSEWEFAVLLPIAKFQKQSEAYVHRESRRMIK